MIVPYAIGWDADQVDERPKISKQSQPISIGSKEFGKPPGPGGAFFLPTTPLEDCGAGVGGWT